MKSRSPFPRFLTYDPKRRITSEEALEHEYFEVFVYITHYHLYIIILLRLLMPNLFNIMKSSLLMEFRIQDIINRIMEHAVEQKCKSPLLKLSAENKSFSWVFGVMILPYYGNQYFKTNAPCFKSNFVLIKVKVLKVR